MVQLGLLLVSMFMALSDARAQAHEGGISSGGGNAIVCFRSQRSATTARREHQISNELLNDIESIEVYDLYAARQSRGQSASPRPLIRIEDVVDAALLSEHQQLVRQGRSHDQERLALETRIISRYIESISRRFEFTLPIVAHAIRDGKEAFSGASLAWQENGVFETFDVNPDGPVETRNCVLTAMATQQSQSDRAHFLNIDKRLYDHPLHRENLLGKAVLFLHEYIYLEARSKAGHTDSANARAEVGYMISQDADLTLRHLTQILSGLGVHGARLSYQQTYPLRVLFGLSRTMSWEIAMNAFEAFNAQNETLLTAEIKRFIYERLRYSYRLRMGHVLRELPEPYTVEQCLHLFDFVQLHGVFAANEPGAQRDRERIERYRRAISIFHEGRKAAVREALERYYATTALPLIADIPYVTEELRIRLRQGLHARIEDLVAKAATVVEILPTRGNGIVWHGYTHWYESHLNLGYLESIFDLVPVLTTEDFWDYAMPGMDQIRPDRAPDLICGVVPGDHCNWYHAEP